MDFEKRLVVIFDNPNSIWSLSCLGVLVQHSLMQDQKGYVYFQDFVPNNLFDDRLVVIGDRCIALRRECRKNDFRASGSGIISYDHCMFNDVVVSLAFKVAKKLCAQSVALDFIYGINHEPYIVEISYGFSSGPVYERCDGYWTADGVWHNEKVCPQFFIIEDFISELQARSRKMLENPAKLGQRHRLAFLFKDSFIYGGATALSRAASLVTFPLLTRYFAVEEYGLIDLFMVFANFLAISFVFGQDSSVARYFYEYTEDVDRRELISQSFYFQIFLLVLILPFLWITVDQFAPMLSSSSKAAELLKLNILQVPFLLLNNFTINILKWTFSRSKFLLISLGSVFTYMILLVVGTTIYKMDVSGVFICALLSQSTFSLIGLYFVRAWIVIPSKFQFLPELLIYALPYGIICCLSAFVPTMERLLVSGLVGGRELGLYAAGAKIAMLMGVVIQAFQTAWGPFSLSIHKESDAIQTYNWALKGFVLLVCLMVIILSSLSNTILNLLTSDSYEGASVVVLPLTIGLAVQSTGWIMELGISLSKKSYLNLYSYIFFVLTGGLLIYFLGGLYGLKGIAYGMMCAHIVRSAVASYLAQKVYPLDWSYRSVFISFICMLMVHFTFQHYVLIENGYCRVLIESILFVILGLLFILSRFEINNLVRFIHGSFAQVRLG